MDTPHQDEVKALRAALACAIGALSNACISAANSTAELLGGDDPMCFAEEVRALAEAHEEELHHAMAQGARNAARPSQGPGNESVHNVRGAGVSSIAQNNASIEFWSRQSELWTRVFLEQQSGLLQLIRAQGAELQHGRQRISSLEQYLPNLERQTASVSAVTPATTDTNKLDRLGHLQEDYERRLSELRDRELAVETGELRVRTEAERLVSQRNQLNAGIAALSQEADTLR